MIDKCDIVSQQELVEHLFALRAEAMKKAYEADLEYKRINKDWKRHCATLQRWTGKLEPDGIDRKITD